MGTPLNGLDVALLDIEAEPSQKAARVLVEAKRSGMPWNQAWLNAMRAFCPPRTADPAVHAYFEAERALMHEVKPWWQAAFEDRDVSAAEFETVSAQSEKRLDQLMSA